jgi:hypothetical protein
MGSYFKPWRRRIGMVTLVMACVFAAGWVRSRYFFDQFSVLTKQDILCLFNSESSELTWSTWTNVSSFPMFDSGPASPRDLVQTYARATYRCRFCGLKSCDNDTEPYDSRAVIFHAWTIPYWSVVIPLTLLSAWLLLSKVKTSSGTAPQKSDPR